MKKIAILGAGMAGFGASYRLHSEEIKSVLYEKNIYYGGHAASFQHNGFVFDDGPHGGGSHRLDKLGIELSFEPVY